METKQVDLSLGSFGPYNKEILGVSHVADARRGAAFQIEMFPGYFRSRTIVANAMCDDGCKMWGADADLTHFSYRYEMEWKDRLYCDVDYAVSDDRRCDITCTFVNNTELSQSVNMNMCASLQRPYIKNRLAFVRFKTFYSPALPEDCLFRDAVEYDDILCAERLAIDGKYLAERDVDCATGMGTAVAGGLFTAPEHSITYRFDGKTASALGIRLSTAKGGDLRVTVDGVEHVLHTTPAEGFLYYTLTFAPQAVREVVVYPATAGATIDSLILGDGAAQATFTPDSNSVTPTVRRREDSSLVLGYEGIDHTYRIRWAQEPQLVRSFRTHDIEVFLRRYMHDHVSTFIDEGGARVYENVLSEPLTLAPGEKKTISFTLTVDEGAEQKPAAPFFSVAHNSDGAAYAFSQNMMVYTCFLNVVYPIYTRRQFIKHNTPGRFVDSLYTWDSGFTGMGLGSADFRRAYECLNTYLTPEGDRHSPFLFHGSVVPTQIFLYKYLFDKFPEHREELRALFPMVRQYYRFFTDLRTDEKQMKSGLLKLWHIFYNSGGWDDYPPQWHIMMNTGNGVSPSYEDTSPVIVTAITVLIAKMLKKIAVAFGEPTEEYDECIASLSAVLQNGIWDEEVGYFSYLVHDENGNPKGFLRAADGSNYNRGFDGIYPYIAGVTNAAQDAAIMDNIKEGLMTDKGICVVDKRASYYSGSGYWNGMIWMPHQWVLWQALMDRGESDLAFEIADKALRLWQEEVDNRYGCFEHFMPNGRGAGLHQFSGLSTPVLLFFESYYKPGTVTVGFESVLTASDWNEDKTALHATLSVGGKAPVAIVCLTEGHEYAFTVNGKPVSAKKRTAGAYEIPLVAGDVLLIVTSKN